MKSVKELFTAAKGGKKAEDIVTGRAPMSKSGWSKTVDCLVNDTEYKVTQKERDGGVSEFNISEALRKDLIKTVSDAGCPQKTELDTLKTANICTKNLSAAIPHLVMEYISQGNKFSLPNKENFTGALFLADVPGGTKEVTVRDMKTGETLGTSTITSKDSIGLRTKSPVPEHLKTKVRKDNDGKVVN